MEKETYDRIWNNIIAPIYTNISNNDFYMYFKKNIWMIQRLILIN